MQLSSVRGRAKSRADSPALLFLPPHSFERERRQAAPAVRWKQPVVATSYAAKMACQGCGGRLSRIERKVRPLLIRLVRGEALALSTTQQHSLAAWSAGHAYLVLALEGRAAGLPKHHRRTLCQALRPHNDVFVGLGRWQGSALLFVAARLRLRVESEQAAARTVNGYAALAVLGQCVVKVFGVRRRPSESRFRAPAGRLVEVWPAPSEPAAAWPPLWSLDEVGVEEAFSFNHLAVGLIGHPVVMNDIGRRARLAEQHAGEKAAGPSRNDLLISGRPVGHGAFSCQPSVDSGPSYA